MKKKYFNKRSKQRSKSILQKNGGRKKMLSKRMGGVSGASVVLENRNVNAILLGKEKKQI